jgi:hypothetical protein
MRAFRLLNVAIFSVLIAVSVAVRAQDEKPQDDKPKAEEPKQQDTARPADKQDDMKAPRQDDAKAAKQDKNEQKQEEKQSRDDLKQNDMKQDDMKQDDMKTPAHAQPAGQGGRIPDDKFRAHFGRSHTFHPSRPQVVNGQPQFQYGGYSFIMVEAWPVGWAYSDDCYIDYVDGEYFLFDLLHPGVRISLTVVL